MPFSNGGKDKRKRIFLFPGIVGFPGYLRGFMVNLTDAIDSNWRVRAYSDPRLEGYQKISSLTFPEMGSRVAAELITETQQQSNTTCVVLYSFDCLLAPYLQERFNEIKQKNKMNEKNKNISFVLIDQPAIEIIQTMKLKDKIEYIHKMLYTVGSTHSLDTIKINVNRYDFSECAFPNIEETWYINLINKIADITIPNLEDQIHRKNSDPNEMNRASRVIPLVIENLKTLFTPIKTPDVNLENVLYISTKKTKLQFDCADEYLGWSPKIKDKQSLYFKDDKADHFSIMSSKTIFSQEIINKIAKFFNIEKRITTKNNNQIQQPNKLPVRIQVSYLEKMYHINDQIKTLTPESIKKTDLYKLIVLYKQLNQLSLALNRKLLTNHIYKQNLLSKQKARKYSPYINQNYLTGIKKYQL